jgi:hypothetical protein
MFMNNRETMNWYAQRFMKENYWFIRLIHKMRKRVFARGRNPWRAV